MQDFLTAKNARELFQKIVNGLKHKDPSINFAKIARLSGISSRSLPREVYTGRRSLTPSFTDCFTNGCRIPSAISQRLKLLVEIERSKKLSQKKVLLQKLNKNQSLIKQHAAQFKVKQECIHAHPQKNENVFLEWSHFTNVFASLGGPGYGKSFSQIVEKSQAEPIQVRAVLNLLIENQILEQQNLLYFLKQNHIDFNFSKAFGPFQKYFCERLRLAGAKAKAEFSSPEMLFWEATISVSQKDLPLLKEKLRTVLENFAAETENGYGDSLVSLSTAFFDPRN
jgi:hypothetical protein